MLSEQRGDRGAGVRGAGAARVAVLDIDAHHGNGTQAIFYGRGDVYVGSVHVDPGAGWFPHYVGYADERGDGDGLGANRNLPLAPGTATPSWLAAVDVICEDVRASAPTRWSSRSALDAAESDPESPLRVSADGYRQATARIGELGPRSSSRRADTTMGADRVGRFLVAALARVDWVRRALSRVRRCRALGPGTATRWS